MVAGFILVLAIITWLILRRRYGMLVGIAGAISIPIALWLVSMVGMFLLSN